MFIETDLGDITVKLFLLVTFVLKVKSHCATQQAVIFATKVTGIGSQCVFSSVRFLTCTVRTSHYSTCLTWAHTPVINWVVCLGQMVSN